MFFGWVTLIYLDALLRSATTGMPALFELEKCWYLPIALIPKQSRIIVFEGLYHGVAVGDPFQIFHGCPTR